MAIYVAAIDGMTSHDAGDVTSFETSLISQEGVVLQTGSDLAVTAQGTPDMTVAVAKGSCYILRDAHVTADNSLKFWKVVVTAATNVTIPSADASNPRIDLICVKIDTGASPDATASNVATLVNVEGTAAASPSAPSVPTNHLKLAEIAVPALDTTISSGQITDYRTYTGLVVPYSSGYRLMDTAGNLEGQLHEDSSGRVIMRSSRSGGEIRIDPLLNKLQHRGTSGESLSDIGNVTKTGTETLTNKTLTSPIITSPTTTGADGGVETYTNKRITRRVGTTTSSATPTINTDNVDFYSLTAQAEAITSFTTNLSGTPTTNQTLWIAITGTAARAITWGTSFENGSITLPTTTVTTTRLDVGFTWNTVTSKWRCMAAG